MLSAASSPFEAAADVRQQRFYLERLAEQSGGTERGGPFAAGNSEGRRDDDRDGGEGRYALSLFEEPPAVPAGHEHVQQNDVGDIAGETVQRVAAILRREDRKALLAQNSG